jgi:uncharacterized protein YigA (DUF484 family)
VEVVEDPKTPTTKTINIANVYDWQQRAKDAEKEVSIEQAKLERERRKNQRLQSQISEYIEALARSSQDCSQAINQSLLTSNTNLALSKELQKAKLMVETLESVIVLLYTTSKDKENQDG